MLRRASYVGLGAVGVGAAGTAYVNRPKPWVKPPEDSLSENVNEDETALMTVARVYTFVTGTAILSVLMHVMNKFELKKDKHYDVFLQAVKERPPGVPLLTVSNHCSPLDDPGVLVGMLPASVSVKPERMRWTICAQEICFKWTALSAAFGSAKVLPIARGEGIDQRLFLNYYRRFLAGGWCHIFPEGHCEQDGALGGRAPGPDRDRHGRLKWGAGKIIAHATITPVVIPLFHTGMANVVPINPVTRKILHAIPRWGHTVTGRAGRALCFDDLLEEHTILHGPIRKLNGASTSSSDREGTEEGGGKIVAVPGGREGDKVWRSTPEERLLYSKIARRIEEALLDLEAEARRDLGADYPGLPEETIELRRAAER